MNDSYPVPVVTGTPLPPPIKTGAAGVPHVTYNANMCNNNTMDPDTVQTLRQQGFTEGLIEALYANQRAFAQSIWIVDNSGSMAARDGHKLVETNTNSAVQLIPCSRWAELQQSCQYHVQLAALLKAPTQFRLLNDPGSVAGPQFFDIATTTKNDMDVASQVDVALMVLRQTTPSGVTPLVPHLQAIRQQVQAWEPQLRTEGTKIVIALATDGLPSDERGISNAQTQHDFVKALRALEGLPVWMVVRLCTDEEQVVEFWNNLDSQLELSLEVLDDFCAEAKEVHEAGNGWLNYGLPLHRMREMGFYSKLFDMLDERTLGKDELRDMIQLLFGTAHMDGLPDPEVDWTAFVEAVDRINQTQGKTWNPVTKRMEHWIDIRKLKVAYSDSKGWWWWFW